MGWEWEWELGLECGLKFGLGLGGADLGSRAVVEGLGDLTGRGGTTGVAGVDTTASGFRKVADSLWDGLVPTAFGGDNGGWIMTEGGGFGLKGGGGPGLRAGKREASSCCGRG